MIKTEQAYIEAIEKLNQDKLFIKEQTKKLEEIGLEPDHIELASQPYISFHEQLKEEVEYYEKIKTRGICSCYQSYDTRKNFNCI